MGPRALRWLLIALHAVLGIAALAAGQAFVREPSGRALGMSTDYLDGSPFRDFRAPGLFLAGVIGSANLGSVVALQRRSPRSALVSLSTGLLLMAWIAIQTAIIGFRHWSQVVWWVVFAAVTAIAAILAGDERRLNRDAVDSPTSHERSQPTVGSGPAVIGEGRKPFTMR